MRVQNEIVSKIESTRIELKKLNETSNSQLHAINQLSNSILNEFFGKYEIPDEA
jgi:hypothetical protein